MQEGGLWSASELVGRGVKTVFEKKHKDLNGEMFCIFFANITSTTSSCLTASGFRAHNSPFCIRGAVMGFP